MAASLRKVTAELLEPQRTDARYGRWVDALLIALIVANVIAVILETVPWLRQRFGGFFWRFELFSVAVFTVEYLLRIWSCVEQGRFRHPVKGRLRWALTPLALIDLIAIAPFYIALLIFGGAGQPSLILRIFRGLRLLRLFKLTRYSPALQILRQVLKKEAASLAVAGFILAIVLVIASWGVYAMEHKAQPEAFGHIPAAMWWTIVTLTTVGYGDVVPITAGGKIFAGIISLIGIGMVALPAGILASGFSSEVTRRTKAYNRALRAALADGTISEHEAGHLEELRERLGISEDESHYLADAMKKHYQHSPGKACPHCGEPLK